MGIPYHKENDRLYYLKDPDLGWVFYSDENKSLFGDHGYWEQIRISGVRDMKRIYAKVESEFSGEALREQMSRYSQSLLNMSKVERDRENRLMYAMTGSDFSSSQGKDFIRNFNEIVQGQERFTSTLDRVVAAINKGGKQRAPSQAVNFTSYFSSALNEELKMIDIDKMLNYYTDADWDKFFEKVANNAVDKMLNKMKQEEGKEHFGSAKDYEGLDQYLYENPNFHNFVRSYLKIEDIKSEIAKIYSGAKKKRRKNITINDVFKTTKYNEKTKKDENVGNESFARMVGGFIQEFLNEGKMEVEISSKGFDVTGNSISSNIGATDTVTLMTRDYKLDVTKLYNEMDSAMNGESQQDIAMALNGMNRKLKKQKYSDLFVIHGSDKLYTMGDSFKGFDKTQKIQDIQYLLDKTDLGGKRFGHELVTLYYNTAKGTALNGSGTSEEKAKLEEMMRVIVAAIAGKLLFSDWTMIGYEEGGATQIHIFDLDGVMIPLSYILEGMSIAMKEFGETGLYNGPITISQFKRPSNVEFPASKGENRYPGLQKNEKGNVVDFNRYWLEQRDKSRAGSSFKIKFMSNFKKIVKELAQTF